MATTPKKSTSGTRGGKSSGSRGGSRTATAPRAASSARTAAGKNTKRPIRRELAGVVMLLLALIVLVSYFTGDGWLIDLIPKFFKGINGIGFYLLAPALAVASWVLLTHRGRPVALRTACALLVPYLFGGVCHMLFCKVDLETPEVLFSTLWKTGFTLQSGGVLSGGTAHGFLAVLGKPASVIIFLVLILVLLMVVFEQTPSSLLQLWRERRDYSEDDYEDEDDYVPVKKGYSKPATPSRKPAARPRPSIDIPLDGETRASAEPEEQRDWEPKRNIVTGFFRPKEKDRLTPADVLETAQQTQTKDPVPMPEAVPETLASDPMPVQEEVRFQEQAAPVPPPPIAVEPAPPMRPVPTAEPAPVPVEEPEGKRKGKSSFSAEDVEDASAQVAAEIEHGMAEDGGDYDYPPATLLELNAQDNYIEAGAELRVNAQRLEDTLRSFGVDAAPGDVVRGPAITRYEFMLAQGVKLSKVTNLAGDIALALGASGVRIAPIPEKISVVGFEVPNKTVSPVLIRDVIESRAFREHRSPVAFAIGRDIGNRDIVGDIAKLPHILIAGTTGSGKSVCTNSLIISLLYKSSPEDVRFIMVDPKMVELAPYNGIPHLLIPVVTDPKKAAGALQWAVYEMMKRYKTFSELRVKKLEEYNALAQRREDVPHMASVVVVIDELADLMTVAAKEVEDSICRVAQMGRAAGMHLVIATQRPSSDVITGLMKANIPSRIAFAVKDSVNSRIILDDTGAEKLVGRGDMLYAPIGSAKPLRVQGCYITPEEIDRVVNYVKSTGEAQYSDEVMQKIEESVQEKDKKGSSGGTGAAAVESEDSGDALLPAAVDVILETGQASVSMLQRRLRDCRAF